MSKAKDEKTGISMFKKYLFTCSLFVMCIVTSNYAGMTEEEFEKLVNTYCNECLKPKITQEDQITTIKRPDCYKILKEFEKEILDSELLKIQKHL